MTNEERDALIAQGWTPPEPVDPDRDLARRYVSDMFSPLHILDVVNLATKHRALDYVLGAIKEGRTLAAAEAKPGMVWVKHDGSNHCPVDPDNYVWIKRHAPLFGQTAILTAGAVGWPKITHYAIITPPEDVA